jgi:DNA-binding NarL/FixJ family response regulator
MSDGAQENLIRLVLVDELGLFRASLACFLSSEPGYQVTGQCGTSAEALDLLKSSTPDVVLLDFEIGTEHANDFISAAMESGYQGHFLLVAGAADIRKSAVVFAAGASGILLKSESPERLLKAIKAVVEGGVWVDPKVIRLLAHQVLDHNTPFDDVGYKTPDSLLDQRERNVLLGIVGGLPNRANR